MERIVQSVSSTSIITELMCSVQFHCHLTVKLRHTPEEKYCHLVRTILLHCS